MIIKTVKKIAHNALDVIDDWQDNRKRSYSIKKYEVKKFTIKEEWKYCLKLT